MNTLVKAGVGAGKFSGLLFCAVNFTGRVHGHGVYLHPQKCGIDKDLAGLIKFGDKPATRGCITVKDSRQVCRAVKGASSRWIVGCRGGAGDINVVVRVKTDGSDKSIRWK